MTVGGAVLIGVAGACATVLLLMVLVLCIVVLDRWLEERRTLRTTGGRLPHVGAIVRYFGPQGDSRAEIRWVDKTTPWSVCLVVSHPTLGRSAVHDVLYSERGECGTWRWPEREDAAR